MSVEADSTVDYQETVAGYARSIRNDLEGIYNLLDFYVNADIMQEEDFDAAGEWLVAHESVRASIFDFIMVVDKNGLTYNDTGSRTDISSRDYFKEVVFNGKERYIDDPVISKTTGEYVVHFTRAVKVNGRTFVAVVGVVPLTAITKEINEIKFGTAAYGWLLTSDGTVMAHRNPDYLMQKNFITNPTPSHEEIIEIAKRMVKGATAQDTSAAITQIIANIESMHGQISNQVRSVNQTASAVNEIASNIESLENMIQTQSSGVTQASAAVEEMIGNISSVNMSVDKMAASFKSLQSNTQSGIVKQQAVNEQIQRIEQQSAMLQEANAAISAIAEQNNGSEMVLASIAKMRGIFSLKSFDSWYNGCIVLEHFI